MEDDADKLNNARQMHQAIDGCVVTDTHAWIGCTKLPPPPPPTSPPLPSPPYLPPLSPIPYSGTVHAPSALRTSRDGASCLMPALHTLEMIMGKDK